MSQVISATRTKENRIRKYYIKKGEKYNKEVHKFTPGFSHALDEEITTMLIIQFAEEAKYCRWWLTNSSM